MARLVIESRKSLEALSSWQLAAGSRQETELPNPRTAASAPLPPLRHAVRGGGGPERGQRNVLGSRVSCAAS